jgi:phosphate transport system substrate-binding protein
LGRRSEISNFVGMKTPWVISLLSLGAVLHAQPALQLHGSTTVQVALEARHQELEALVGRKIEFSATGTSAGLLSLAEGRADVAMLSAPLDEVARMLNEKTPGTIDVGKFSAALVGHVKMAFIVNPHNPARTLSAAQLADIFTGKIKNWKEVGGKDAAIKVVALANAGQIVRDTLLHGAAVTPDARQVSNALWIPPVVAQDVDAIGIISTTQIKGLTTIVQTDAEIVAPLFLVTKEESAAEAKKLIEAVRQLLSRPD